MTLPIDTTDLSAPSVLDLVVTTNLTFVRYDNLTIVAYFRPSTLGSIATAAPSGSLSLNVAALSPLTFYDIEPSTNNLNLFVIANSYASNQLTQYRATQVFNSQGQLIDVTFKSLQTLSLSTQIAALAASTNYVILGCSVCNSMLGQVNVYNRTAISQMVASVSGVSGNQNLGLDVQAIALSSNFDTFYVGSSSGGSQNTKLSYVNFLNMVKS